MIPEVAEGITVVEDFEDGNWAGWHEVSRGDWMMVTPTAAFLDGSLGLEVIGSNWMYRNDTPVGPIGPGDVISVWLQRADVAEGDVTFAIGFEDFDMLSVGMSYSTGEMKIECLGGRNDPTTLASTNVSGGLAADQWYRLEIEWTDGDGDVAAGLYDINDELIPGATVSATAAWTAAGGLAWKGYAGSPTYFDSILLAPNAAGHELGNVPDFYQQPADEYEFVTDGSKTVEVFAPGSGPGEFNNQLLPAFNPAPPPAGGTFTVQGAMNSFGEYFLVEGSVPVAAALRGGAAIPLIESNTTREHSFDSVAAQWPSSGRILSQTIDIADFRSWSEVFNVELGENILTMSRSDHARDRVFEMLGRTPESLVSRGARRDPVVAQAPDPTYATYDDKALVEILMNEDMLDQVT